MAPPLSRLLKTDTDEQETTVEINQKALVNILTRYPGPFDVFRELIQNADDAEAQTVQIHFQTGKNVAADVDISKVKVRKWIIKNDGNPLKDEDWRRLSKIAEGNRNSSKVGAFGVGFYIVLSICDKPLVKSNGRFLQMTRREESELRVKTGSSKVETQDTNMTLVELDLKPDVQEPLPKLVDLARFLVSSITFLEKVHTISVFLDAWTLLRVHKERTVVASIGNFENTCEILAITSMDYATQRVTIDAIEQAFPRPTELLAENADATEDQVAEIPQVPQTSDTSLSCNLANSSSHVIVYDLYTAQVQANPSQDTKKGVESVMKALPDQFSCKVVYFNSEQHKVVEESTMVHLFRGSHGIFDDNNGRIFIGQSTRQSTGIGLHIGSHFLPTVERGTVDLTNGQVAVWNAAVFEVAGCLARVVYDREMGNAEKTGSDQRRLGLFTMNRFAFEGQADDRVSQHLKNGFFSAEQLRVLTATGITSVAKVRRRHGQLSFLQNHRFLSDDLSTRHRALLIERCKIPTILLQDLVDGFIGGMSEDQTVAFIDWWATSGTKFRNKEGFVDQLRSKGRLHLNGEEVVINKVKQYTFITAEKDLLSPDTLYIPESLATVLDRVDLFGWAPLGILGWLRHCARLLQDANSPEAKKSIGYRVFAVLTGPQGVSCLSEEKLFHAKKLLESVECIRTNKGLKTPNESYFPVTGILEDVPVIDDQGLPKEVRRALEHLGVRRRVDWDMLLSGLEVSANADTNGRLLRYLVDVKHTSAFDAHIKDLKKRKVFTSERHGRCLSTDLYRPDLLDSKLRDLGLPILDLLPSGKIDAHLADIFECLGVRKCPPLLKIVEWLSEPSVEEVKIISRECLRENERGYRAEAARVSSIAFVPTSVTQKLAAPCQVVRSAGWAIFGFNLISESLKGEGVLLEVLGIEEGPPVAMLIDFLKNTPPTMEEARPWFEQLASHPQRNSFHGLSDIPFVPNQTDFTGVEYKYPAECFVVSSDHKPDYLFSIFPIVDFGEDGNQFLVDCGATRGLPQAPHIAQEMANDPVYYLQRIGDNFKRYRDDLEHITAKFDTIPEDVQEDMRTQPMLLATFSNGYELRLAANILIGEDKENLSDFSNFAFMAPAGLETLYEKLGSKYLDEYVDCIPHVESSRGSHTADTSSIRDKVLRCAGWFMSDEREDGRQPIIPIDDLREKHNLQVKLCSEVRLEKVFAPPPGYLLDEGIPRVVSPTRLVAAVPVHEPTDDRYTLWIAKNHESDLTTDIGRALCFILQMGKRQDLARMELFLKDATNLKDDVERMFAALDFSYPSDIYMPPPPYGEQPSDKGGEQVNGGHLVESHHSSASLHLKDQHRKPKPESKWGYKSKWRWSSNKHLLCEFDPINLAKDAICPKTNKASSEEYRKPSSGRWDGASDPKEDTRCKSIKTQLHLDPGNERYGFPFYWDKYSRRRKLDEEVLGALNRFAKIVYGLAQVFEVRNPSATFSIIWKDKDEDLMGFNSDQELIFLNLAYYFKYYYKAKAEEQKEVTDWYFIIAHEIAHNKSLCHDKIHESTFAGLCVRHLNALLRQYPCCEEYLQSRS